jgi:hypothetical protein
MSYSDEVQRCFEENPDLFRMSPVRLGEWFYIQGILYQSNVVEALSNKFIHFSKHLTKKQLDKANSSWSKVQISPIEEKDESK